MKIEARRDMVKNINYGTVVYTLDDHGNAEVDDPVIILNADYKEDDNCVMCASLNDGMIDILNDYTIVEVADIKLVINKF